MEACQNPDILRVIFYIKEILSVVFIIVPIGLIVMIGIDFFKNVTAGKEDEMKKNLGIAIKRIIYCVFIFFVPTIVSLVNAILGDLGVNYVECMNGATLVNIEDKINEQAALAVESAKSSRTMESVLEAETLVNKMKDSSQKEEYLNTLASIKQEIIDEEKQKQEEDNPVTPSPGGDSNSPGTGGPENYGPGTEGDYFAPIQGISNYYIGTYGSTAGCSNSVYHDLSNVASGTPIYAGIDGEAKFMQTTSSHVVSGKTVLTSYGNQVKITASDGTFIIYAHLLKFADGINAPITETCPKKGSSPPCPASVYASGTSVSDTKQVKKGDLIGYLGDTGNSTGAHLHVEIHEGGSSYCRSDPWKAFGMR